MYSYPFHLLLTSVCYRILNAVDTSDFHQILEKLGLNLVYKASKNVRTCHETEFPIRMYSLLFNGKFCYK